MGIAAVRRSSVSQLSTFNSQTALRSALPTLAHSAATKTPASQKKRTRHSTGRKASKDRCGFRVCLRSGGLQAGGFSRRAFVAAASLSGGAFFLPLYQCGHILNSMKKKRATRREIPIGKSSGNVYADLGYADSEDMLVKAQIVAKIAEIIEHRRLTQGQAAEILGLTQPKISRLLRGQFRGVSERRLLRCLTKLGRDVQIVVRPTSRRRPQGRLTVRFG
jgi:predicted XRE-type DNA-binding protein